MKGKSCLRIGTGLFVLLLMLLASCQHGGNQGAAVNQVKLAQLDGLADNGDPVQPPSRYPNPALNAADGATTASSQAAQPFRVAGAAKAVPGAGLAAAVAAAKAQAEREGDPDPILPRAVAISNNKVQTSFRVARAGNVQIQINLQVNRLIVNGDADATFQFLAFVTDAAGNIVRASTFNPFFQASPIPGQPNRLRLRTNLQPNPGAAGIANNNRFNTQIASPRFNLNPGVYCVHLEMNLRSTAGVGGSADIQLSTATAAVR